MVSRLGVTELKLELRGFDQMGKGLSEGSIETLGLMEDFWTLAQMKSGQMA